MQPPADLLERERELSELDAALARARLGNGQVIVIEGPGGIGKTRLLAAGRAGAREAGMLALHARGSELERSFTFGVARQLFESALFAATDAERDRWLAGAAGLTRSLLEDVADAQEESSYARLHGLYWLCANLAADQPLLLTVDDAQWADEPSLTFLGFLVRRLEDLPAALVLGTRPRAEQGSAVLRSIVSDPATRMLRPQPLSDGAVGRWVRREVDAGAGEGFCRACHETTGGNPFLVSELVHEVVDKQLRALDAEAETVRALGPEGISTVVLQRLARLPAAAPALARAVALVGEGASPAVAAELAELAELAEASAEEALEALCRAGILTHEGEVLGFVHPIVLAAIYGDLSRRSRGDGHARAARLLHARGATPAEVASHLVRAPARGDPWAVEMLRAAAARALALGDPATAVTYLDRALAEPPAEELGASLYADLAGAESQSGRPAAVEHFREAIRRAATARERAQFALGLARSLKFRGDSPAAIAVLRDALAELGEADRDVADELEVELISSAYISLSGRPLLVDEIARLTTPETPCSRLDRVHLSSSAFEIVLAAGPAERSAELARRALAGAELTTDVAAGGQVYLNAAIALMFSECFDEAEQLYGRAVAEARRRGSSVGFAAASSLRAFLRYRRGALPEAEADATAALDLRNDVEGSQAYLACALSAIVFATLDRGAEGPDLMEFADEFFATQPSEDLPYSVAMHARGWLRAVLGDPRGGLDELLACGKRECLAGAGTPATMAWRSAAAEVCLMLGKHEQAQRLAAEELELARSIGAPRVLGVALRAVALTEPPGRRVELLREAVATLEDSRATLELARARIDLGTALVRAGHREDARGLLRGGQELAFGCGATALVTRANRELLATGARPRRTAASARDDLTPSERRVTEMAAEGLTNREIAQALFVTEKTVETHLGRAFVKLGVRSRKQLPEALRRVAAGAR